MDVVETRHHIDQGTFTGTGLADKGDEGALGDAQGDIVESLLFAVGEGDVGEGDVVLKRFFGNGLGLLGNFVFHVEVFEDAVGGGQGLLQFSTEFGEFFERAVGEIRGGDEDDDVIESHFVKGVEHEAADGEDGDEFHQRRDQQLVLHGFHHHFEVILGGVVEFSTLFVFLIIGFNDADTAEDFLHAVGDSGDALEGAVGVFFDFLAEQNNRQDGKRHADKEDGHEAVELIFDGEPDDVAADGDDFNRSARQAGNVAGDGRLNLIDVIGAAAHHIADGFATVEFHALPGQLAEQLIAQIGYDPQTDPAHQKAVTVGGNRLEEHNKNETESRQG